MFKKILVFYLLVCVFMCKETYASNIHDETGIEKTQQEENKYKRKSYNFFKLLSAFNPLPLFKSFFMNNILNRYFSQPLSYNPIFKIVIRC